MWELGLGKPDPPRTAGGKHGEFLQFSGCKPLQEFIGLSLIHIFAPDREVPGIRASIWNTPIHSSIRTDSSEILVFQMLALIPGTSRSGATIVGALIIGVSREVAAEFTFFLAIPRCV